MDYVDRVYPFLYDPESLDKDKNTKAEIIKKQNSSFFFNIDSYEG